MLQHQAQTDLTITAKQIEFILKLGKERCLTTLPNGISATDSTSINRMSRRDASKLIDQLLQIKPGKSIDSQTTKLNGVDLSKLHGGYYAATINGITKFFKIDKIEEGKWSGWVFVKILASDVLHKQGSQKPNQAYTGNNQDYMAEIAKDEQKAMTLFGKEIGRCGHCGRTLTDEESRKRGIGPICSERMGW